MADWENCGEAGYGAWGGDTSGGDRKGQKEYNAYHKAATKHGASSPQAREALGKALAAGWSFSGVGPGGDNGGRRKSGRGQGSLYGEGFTPVDQ